MGTEQDLARSWTHSHEEDRAGTLVFRPSDHAFPPSRGRRRFDLHADRSLTLVEPGAADAPRQSNGSWDFVTKDSRLLLTSAGSKSATESWKVLSVDKDRLVLQR